MRSTSTTIKMQVGYDEKPDPFFPLPDEVLSEEVNYIPTWAFIPTFNEQCQQSQRNIDKGYDAVFVGTGRSQRKGLT
jgi:hypothetical protein